MVYLLLIVVVQLATIVHVVRTGRNGLWILGILIAPLLGSLAYFLIEVLPGMQGNRHVRYARKKAIQKIDPEREIRAAREQLEITDSVANRIDLADALAADGQHSEAIEHYESVFASPHGRTDEIRFKYAGTLFEHGHAERALAMLDEIESDAQPSIQDRRSLLRARVLEHLGDNEAAAAIYDDIVTRMAGIEARCRYAALLIELGRQSAAQLQLEEVMRTARNRDRTQIGDDKPMLDWAKATLAELGG